MKKINLLIAFLLVSVTTPALATPSCDHPVFQVVGCTYPDDVGPAGQNGQDGADGQDGQDGIDGRNGVDGRDGIDGADGIDGVDGKDGRDGINGIDGLNGRDGKDGVIPESWLNDLKRQTRYSLAMDAAQVYLPQDKNSRFTMGAARGHGGKLGLGVGYAYVMDDGNRTAFTIALGISDDETAGRVSAGFEF